MTQTNTLGLDAKAYHELLTAALLASAPDTERARELRGMVLELESDVKPQAGELTFEQRRVLEMAARRREPAPGEQGVK